MDREALMRSLLLGAAALLATSFAALSDEPKPADWTAVLDEARGETVYWNAWGSSENINAYIEWAGAELSERYGV